MSKSKDEFFEVMAKQRTAITFENVRLKTGYSEVMPRAVNITSRFSRNVGLQCPMVSSPMDTITESPMGIVMAMEGGLGIIHANFTPEKQAAEVTKVKTCVNAIILKPVCVRPEDTVGQVEEMGRKEHLNFHSFPVVNDEGQLVGLVTKTNFDLCTDPSLPISAIMLTCLTTAPTGTNREEAFELMKRYGIGVLPIIDDMNRLVSMYSALDRKRIKTGSHANYNLDDRGNLRVGAAISTGESEIARAELLVQAGVDVIVIDTAHGDSKPVFEILKKLKAMFPKTDIVAGNVSEGDSAKRLVDAGADGIRVGQGGGSICKTRIVAGVGCPQVTAIRNCAKAVEGSGIPICADGGIKNFGDVPIAIGTGAESVMLGRALAGTDETPGDTITVEGVHSKIYRGMGSLAAMKDGAASRKRYSQNDTGKDLVPEGEESVVPYQGPLYRVLHQYIGGLRAGMGYVGAKDIKELIEKADFWFITDAGMRESYPHDIQIINNSQTYKGANS